MNRLAETHFLQTTDAEVACKQGLVSTFAMTLKRVNHQYPKGFQGPSPEGPMIDAFDPACAAHCDMDCDVVDILQDPNRVNRPLRCISLSHCDPAILRSGRDCRG